MKSAILPICAAILLCGCSTPRSFTKRTALPPKANIAALHARAERGSAQAQNSLGSMYATGRGVRKDYAEAVWWYRKAAERGHALAQNNLGFAYAQGDGVRKDDEEAVRWYRKGAAQGSAPAQNGLGYMYAMGRGVKKDYMEAGKWFLLAARKCQVNAERNYAWLRRRFLTPAQCEELERNARVSFRPGRRG